MSVPVTESLLYDTLCEVMDQVAALDRKVTRLLAAAGVPEAAAATAEGRRG